MSRHSKMDFSMAEKQKLTASQEDYLEAIYEISRVKMAARAKDIADYLKVRASSVTGALRTLGSRGLINYAPYDLITLTDEGRVLAEDVAHRHSALKSFLMEVLGIEHDDADATACKMEHSVPGNIVDRLIKYAEYVEKCPKGKITWDSGFGAYFCKVKCSEPECVNRRPEEEKE